MPTIVEFVYVLRGLRRLIQFDVDGLTYFDRSIEGFWRSFRVAFLVAPIYAIIIPLDLAAIKPSVGWQHIMMVEILAYIVSWLLYPLAAYEVCRLIGREAEYPGYIVVYNWSQILIVAAELLSWLPTLMGITTADTSASLYRIVFFLFLIYLWFIARTALRIDAFSAVGMAFMSFALTRVLAFVHREMLSPAVG
ncbi:MAG TPA: hypothetical protein VLV76_15955 [Candidatus Acidoferrum sp.]|nr:hypothetical protein [Candidatus Acidoferrum sp.]